MKSTVVDKSLSSFKPMYCSREYQASTRMASSDLWKMSHLPMIILSTDGTIAFATSDTGCLMIWQQIVDAGPHSYPMLWCVDTNCEPHVLPAHFNGCKPCTFKLEVWVLNKTSSHMWDNWYFPMFLPRDGSLTLIYMASLITLVMLWDSLP